VRPKFIKKDAPGLHLIVPRSEAGFLVLDRYKKDALADDLWWFEKEEERTSFDEIEDSIHKMRQDYLSRAKN
jgi:hypothetical protein